MNARLALNLGASVYALTATAPPVAAQARAAAWDDPFAAYVIPGECARVVARMDNRYWFTHRPDTVPPSRFGDPARRESIAAARQCVARFSVAKAATRDLLGLGQAYLSAELYAQADSAFQRLLTLLGKQPPAERRWAMVQIVDVYLDARPTRLDDAARYLARLESIGLAAAKERLIAQLRLASQAMRMDSLALQGVATDAAIRASRQLVGDTATRLVSMSREAFSLAADLYGRRADPVGAQALLTAAEPELRAVCSTMTLERERRFYRNWNKPTDTLQVAQWFNAVTAGRKPALGRPSVILWARMLNDERWSFQTYATIKRMRARYPDLEVDVLMETEGAIRAEVVTPDVEMERMRRYFLDDLKLPVTVGVWQTQFRRRELDHGLENLPNPNQEIFPNHMVYLVDRKGLLRYVAYQLSPMNEIRWTNVLGEMP